MSPDESACVYLSRRREVSTGGNRPKRSPSREADADYFRKRRLPLPIAFDEVKAENQKNRFSDDSFA
jgi:hypothetical protein